MLRKFTFGLLILLTANHASAALQSVAPTKANGDFIPGTGIPANDFTVTTAGSGESVALKARGRDSGQPLSINGNTYNVLPGLAANNVSPWWSFDYQFSPGTNGSSPDDYLLTLQVDFDPTAGAATFKTLTFLASANDTANPGPGAWSNDAVPFVTSDSLHLGFAFWNGVNLPAPPFDPNAIGEYEIRFSVSTVGASPTAPPLAATNIFVNVAPVPEPGSLVLMLGLAACGIPVALRRRRS
jgi:hypothetical protein